MALSRPTLTDDNGTRTTGTIFNVVWWTDLFDRMDAAYASLIGATFTGGVIATKFKTASGNTGSIATATATTIFSVASPGVASRWEVSACLNSVSVATYTAFATVVSDGTDSRIVSNNAGGLTITLSGTNVQVTQTSGGSTTVHWIYTKLAA